MKLIDFDELEKLKDNDDTNQIEEDWDGGFFEEFADRVSDDVEEDDEEYLAMPKEILDSRTEDEDIEDAKEEAYVEIPTEIREQYAKELQWRERKAKAEEDHFVVEKAKEDIYELSEEPVNMSLEEKRIKFGRMLGLRGMETVEVENEKGEEPEVEELKEVQEEVQEDNQEIHQEILQEERIDEVSVELPDIDFEAMADKMTEEMLRQQELSQKQETEQQQELMQEEAEPVYYNPLEFGEETNEEYEKFRENYVKRHILHEEEVVDETEPENVNELEIEIEPEIEPESETELDVKSDDVIENDAEVEIDVEAENDAEVEIDVEVENDIEIESDVEEESSSFVDEQEFYRIEQEEIRRIQGESEEYEEIVDEDTQEEEIIDEDTQEKEIVNEDTQEKEIIDGECEVEETIGEETDKKVLNIRDLPASNSASQTISEGVLQKRTLPNRQEQVIKEQQPDNKEEPDKKEEAEKKEQQESNFGKKRASLGLSQGKKIRKLQSAFEDEYLDVLDYDIFERKTKRKRKKSHKRKDYRQNKVDWEEEDETPDKPFKEFFSLMISIVIVVAITFVLVEFVGQRTEVNGESMESTLHDGDNLIVDKITYAFEEPQRFDIVVFPYKMVNSDEEVFYIKRIIGLPGERVQIINGFIYINGELLVESYGKNNNLILNPGRAEREIQLGEDEYFVLGDNRNNSSDSREIGNIKKDDIVGRAWLRMWPLSDFGILKHQ